MEEGQLREMTHINGSLTALGIVIAALTEKKRRHVPYRSSVLTRILQRGWEFRKDSVDPERCL